MTTSSRFLLGLLFAAVTLQNVTSLSMRTTRQRTTSSPVSRINEFPAALALRAISTPIETETQYANMQRTGKAANVVIIGGGPAGLASAIMLARRGYTNVKVFDRLPEPSAPDDASVWNDFETGRNYNIGVSGRGQKALAKLDVLDKIDSFSAKCVGRLEWSPETAGEPKETISGTGTPQLNLNQSRHSFINVYHNRTFRSSFQPKNYSERKTRLLSIR